MDLEKNYRVEAIILLEKLLVNDPDNDELKKWIEYLTEKQEISQPELNFFRGFEKLSPVAV